MDLKNKWMVWKWICLFVHLTLLIMIYVTIKSFWHLPAIVIESAIWFFINQRLTEMSLNEIESANCICETGDVLIDKDENQYVIRGTRKQLIKYQFHRKCENGTFVTSNEETSIQSMEEKIRIGEMKLLEIKM